MRPIVPLALLLTACADEADCLRRVDDAHREALRDVPDCRFAPEALDEPMCTSPDRRPLQTYLAVWCSEAELACIRADEEASVACFGDDATPDPAPSVP